MKYGRKYKQLIPEKILQSFPSIENSIRLKIKGYSSDNLKQVISMVAFHIRKDSGTAQLQISYFKRMVPQGDKYLNELMKLNIIERSGYYKIGESSYKYCFTSTYLSEYKSLPLTNFKLIHRIEQTQIKQMKKANKEVRGHSEQIKYLEALTLEGDYYDHLSSSYTDDIRKYNFAQSSITRVLNGDIFYTVDSTSGRFHSNVTIMPKGIRPYLRIYGEPLGNIDVKNSQPFLSILLLINPSKVAWMARNPEFKRLLQFLKIRQTEDIKLYIDLVVSGKIYEYLMLEFEKEGMILTRDQTKIQVLCILFDQNWILPIPTNLKCRKIFKNRFPTVHRIFSKIRGNEMGDHFKGYQRFAILLQTIEAHLMLDIILKRISRELPGTIAVTIHDSILTGLYTNNVKEVAQIMREEFTKFVGFTPVLKIEINDRCIDWQTNLS